MEALQDQDEKPASREKEKPVGLTLRLSPATHDALRQVAFDRRVSIHSLMLEGVAEVLRKAGR